LLQWYISAIKYEAKYRFCVASIFLNKKVPQRVVSPAHQFQGTTLNGASE